MSGKLRGKPTYRVVEMGYAAMKSDAKYNFYREQEIRQAEIDRLCWCGREKDSPDDRYCLTCEDCREDYYQELARVDEDSDE